jgi:hypothetical protein
MPENKPVEPSSPLLKKEKVEAAIGNLISGILAHADQGGRESDFYKTIVAMPEVLKDPSTFNALFLYPLNNAIKMAIKDVKAPPEEKAHEFVNIHIEYNYYKAHIEKLCSTYSGSFGCADKSRSIIKRYLAFLATGEYGEWNTSDEGCYWLPKFGTQQQWFNFMEGLSHLRYGNPEKYLHAYQALIQQAAFYQNRLKEESKKKS